MEQSFKGNTVGRFGITELLARNLTVLASHRPYTVALQGCILVLHMVKHGQGLLAYNFVLAECRL